MTMDVGYSFYRTVITLQCSILTLQVTAAQHWRAPHLLHANLNTLRDSAATSIEALEAFVDCTGRISIDRKNPKLEGIHEGLLSEGLSAMSCCSRIRQLPEATSKRSEPAVATAQEPRRSWMDRVGVVARQRELTNHGLARTVHRRS